MNDGNSHVVARTPVKKESQPGHQQLRARRFLGNEPKEVSVSPGAEVHAASTPVDPLKTRPVRRLTAAQAAPGGGGVDARAPSVNLQSAFIQDLLNDDSEMTSPKPMACVRVAATEKASSVDLQPACTFVGRSQEVVLMEGPSSPPESCDAGFVIARAMRVGEDSDGSASTSTDVLCEDDATPSAGAARTSTNTVTMITMMNEVATAPSPASPPPSGRLPHAAGGALLATPSTQSSCLPSSDDDDDEEALESGYGSVRNVAEVSSLKDVTVTPQRQCASAARSAPSPSLAFEQGGCSAVPCVVACTPIKAASAAVFSVTTDDGGSSNACRPLSSSFGIRPKATKRFDFVKAFAPVPVTPEKRAQGFARGSAVEYRMARSASATAATSTKTAAAAAEAVVTMRGERWKDMVPPPPLPQRAAPEGSAASFQRAAATTSQHSSSEVQAPRRALHKTERRGSLMQMRETSPASREEDGHALSKEGMARRAAAATADEPFEPGTSPDAARARQCPPPPPPLSTEQVSPASPRTLPSSSATTRRSGGSSDAFDASPDPLVVEKQENFKRYRKRSFCVYSDSNVYDATNAAFKDGIVRTTMPRSAMPYDAYTARLQRQTERENSEDSETGTDTDEDSHSDSSDRDILAHNRDTTTPSPQPADSSATQALLPGVDSTSTSSLSNGKHVDSTGRPITSDGATTRGVSSSNGCTTDEKASRSTSREYEEGEDGDGTLPHRTSSASATLGATGRPLHASSHSAGGRLGLAAEASTDEDDDGLALADIPFRFPMHHNDVVDLSAITIESLDEDAVTTSKSYENFLAVTAPSCGPLAGRSPRGGGGCQAGTSLPFTRAVAELFQDIEAQYDALLTAHREALLTGFLTLTDRCLDTQRREAEKRKAAIFGSKEALPMSIALPSSPRAGIAEKGASSSLSRSANLSLSHPALGGGQPEGFAPMERLTPASPYVYSAVTSFGMAPRTSRPPSAPRSRRGSAADDADATNVSGENGQNTCALVPKTLPKIAPLNDVHAVVVPLSVALPFQSPLRLIFSLATQRQGKDAAETAVVMEQVLRIYFDYHLQEHLRAVQHALFDFMYYTLVAVPGTRMLEIHERRLICMSRDLLIRDRIELFMLTLPKGSRGRSGTRPSTGGAVKLTGGASGTGQIVANFRSAYESTKTKSITAYHNEKERLVDHWTGGHRRTSSSSSPLSAVEEYHSGTGARPASGGGQRRAASSVAKPTTRQSLSAITNTSAELRPCPSSAQLAAVTTAGKAGGAANMVVPLRSQMQRAALPHRRSASLPNVRNSALKEAQAPPPSDQPQITITSRRVNCKSHEGDPQTYRRASGEFELADGTRRLRAKERIRPISRVRTPPPPPSEAQFMNLAHIAPR